MYGSEKRFQQKLFRNTVLCVRYTFHFSLSFWGWTCSSGAPELLNCYTVRTSPNVLPALSHSCFTITIPPLSLCITELHHSAHLFSMKLELLPWSLNIEATCSSETSVSTCNVTLRQEPEDYCFKFPNMIIFLGTEICLKSWGHKSWVPCRPGDWILYGGA